MSALLRRINWNDPQTGALQAACLGIAVYAVKERSRGRFVLCERFSGSFRGRVCGRAFLFALCDVLTDKGAAKSCFGETQVGIGGGAVREDILCTLRGAGGARQVDLVRPLEGGANDRHFAVQHADHAADAGTVPTAFLRDDGGAPHAERRDAVGVVGEDAHFTRGGAHIELLHLPLEFLPVGADDLQREGGHTQASFALR